MAGVGILAGWLIVALAGAVAVALWGRRLWKRRAELSLAAKAMAALTIAVALSTAAGTLAGLVMGFRAMGGEAIDPSQKARVLAEGISDAMNCSALGLLLWIPSALALFLTSRRRGKSAS